MQDLDASNPSELVNFPPKVTVSGTDVRVKEVVLVSMALCLLVCSMCLFFKHWKKNYRDINQVIVNLMQGRLVYSDLMIVFFLNQKLLAIPQQSQGLY